MKLIKPSVEYIPQNCGKIPYEHIELCARTCYKSEDKITIDSAYEFVEGLIMAGHLAMLEHGTIYLNKTFKHFDDNNYRNNKYSVSIGGPEKLNNDTVWRWNITTNLRVLVENNWLDDLQYICEPTEYHKKRYTMKFICDRAIAQQLTRHRVFSFAMESQRWVNYSKKGDKQITFIMPSFCKEMYPLIDGNTAVNADNKAEWEFVHALCDAEQTYLDLITEGWKPEQARKVLPNATKTELIMTGFEDDWRKLFDERLRGTTGKPDEDMVYLMQLAHTEFKNKLELEL